jgi:hypothetical protein
MVFSIIVSPVVLSIRAIVWIVKKIAEGVENFVMNSMIEPAANSWYNTLSDIEAYRIYHDNYKIKKSYKRVYGDSEGWVLGSVFVSKWYEMRYGEPARAGDYGEWTENFIKWRDATEAEWVILSAQLDEERHTKESEAWRKKRSYEDKMQNTRDSIDGFFSRISDAVSSWKNIIKWTKRFVGLLVTSAGLLATYFIVNFSGRGILWLVANWDWSTAGTVSMWTLIVLVGIGALWVLIYVTDNWFKYMKNHGTSLWYVRLLYRIARAIVWPFKIIFYRLLWQMIAVNFAYLIKKVAIMVWKSIIGFFGIFGEYFGASYTDYCPGIDWKEEE